MNKLILTTVFAVVLAAAVQGQKEKAIAAYMKCSKENKVPADDIATFKSGQGLPKSKEAKCLMACMMKEGKIIDGGKYNKDNALKAVDVMLKDNPDAGKAKQVVETCAKEVGTTVGSDECEYAYKMATCSEAQAKKLGIKRPM
ncbi:hypothetical protein O3M35_000359 [Rhynocoris fuscipes]|uniref:Uncharacterized protein n=1 Tax=Rhynocoris fuscipes TaxID=488301 RepID=A0AAW1DN82_9HEMI